jgi:hypothetical protein
MDELMAQSGSKLKDCLLIIHESHFLSLIRGLKISYEGNDLKTFNTFHKFVRDIGQGSTYLVKAYRPTKTGRCFGPWWH